ncbi:MAG TPA: DoxX family protein [Polyangiaceae bacterium]|jgi:hypothetical protein
MKKTNLGYWITVGLFSALYTLSSVMDLFGVGPAHITLASLGYPAYVATILGVWKAGAVVVLLSPGLPRLKEWAYAGIVFDLTGGLASHLFHGDALPKPIIPIVFLGVALTSYWLRPADRRLASPKSEPAIAPARALVPS